MLTQEACEVNDHALRILESQQTAALRQHMALIAHSMGGMTVQRLLNLRVECMWYVFL